MSSEDGSASSPESSRRGSEEDWFDYGQSMQLHTTKLLKRAEKIAQYRARIASEPHNGPSPSISPKTVPTVTKVPHNTPSQGGFMRHARPDPAIIEKAIHDLNHLTIKSGGTSKTASIKTPFNPVAESKKRVLNRQGLRLTLDDRRPTIG